MSGEKKPLVQNKDNDAEDLIEWKEAVFGCFDNIPNCLLGAVPGGSCVMQGVVINKAIGESVLKHCLIACFGCCFGCAYNRQLLRENYHLKGEYWPEVALHCFCNCCATCQEYRQQEYMEKEEDE